MHIFQFLTVELQKIGKINPIITYIIYEIYIRLNYMGLKKEEIVLYALNAIEDINRYDMKFTKDDIAVALDINTNTFDLYLTKLSKADQIDRKKKHFIQDIRDSYDITDTGREEISRINERIASEHLTPERHNIRSIVPIVTILERIIDPLERIFFLALYSKLKRFDLPLFIETMRTTRQDNNIVSLMNKMGEKDVIDDTPVIDAFFKGCFYGITDIDMEKIDDGMVNDPNTLLIIAEASMKQGRYTDSRMIYEHILHPSRNISQNQWVIAKVNLALLNAKAGNPEESIRELEDILKITDNKIFISYTRQVMGRVFFQMKRMNDALNYTTQAINSFHTFGIPLLLSLSYNNRGIIYFTMDRFDEAEEDWKKARRYARESRCTYVEGAIFNNLADIELLKGNFETSETYMDHARKVYYDINDLEGIAWIDFQESLFHLEKKDLEKALEAFRRSEMIAFPSPSPGERKLRREVFFERAIRNSYDKKLIEEKMMEV